MPPFGELGLSEIRPELIEKFKAAKLESVLKPKTINNTPTVLKLRKSLVAAQERELLEAVPPIR